MAAHIFDMDGTLVNYHTSEWLDGAKEMLYKLHKEGHQIILITMRGEQDENTIWSIKNTWKTILNDLDVMNIPFIVLFGVQSPRTIHDDSQIYIDQRKTNETWI